MPIFLGGSDLDPEWVEKYTRSSFKIIPEEKMSNIQKDYYEKLKNNQQNIFIRLINLNGNPFDLNKEDAFKFAHCQICDKIWVDNSWSYCRPCKYYLSFEDLNKYNGGKNEG